MRNLSLPLLLAAMAACAPTPKELAQTRVHDASVQDKLATSLAGLVPGEPLNCMPSFQRSNVEAYGSTLLYKVSRSLIYRSDTAGGCENVGRDVLVTRTPSGSLCRGDIAQTFDPVSRFPTGSCSFGAFVPYRKP